MKKLTMIADVLCWTLIAFAFGYFLAAVIAAQDRIVEVAR
jgi:hypothetical protein